MTATSVESMPPDSPMTTSVKPAPRTKAPKASVQATYICWGFIGVLSIAKALPRVWQRFVSGRLPTCVVPVAPAAVTLPGRSTSMESICSSRPARSSVANESRRAEAVVEVVLELVAAFQADAARADHRQIQRGALGERVGLGQGLEGEHEGILHRLRGLADGDPHTQKPRRAGLAGRLHGRRP